MTTNQHLVQEARQDMAAAVLMTIQARGTMIPLRSKKISLDHYTLPSTELKNK